jgi:hypothetical protein
VSTWTVSDTPVIRIGARDGAAAYLFQRISAVRQLEDGGLAVGDLGSESIRIFGPDGAFLRQLGRRGEGPGEFGWVGDVFLAGSDTLIAYDPTLSRLTRFLLDGTLLSTRSVQAPSGVPEFVLGRYSDGGWAMAWIATGEMKRDSEVMDPDPMVVARFAPDGSMVRILGTGPGMVRQTRGPVPFSPFFHGVLLRDSAFVTNGQEARIQVMAGSGGSARTLDVDMPPVDPAAARRALEAALDVRDQSERLVGIPEAGWDRPVPRIAQMIRGEGDRLWLKQYEPTTDSWLVGAMGGRQSGGTWTVVEPDGTVVARVTLPDGFIPKEVAHGRVAGVGVDALGVERAVVYGVER